MLLPLSKILTTKIGCASNDAAPQINKIGYKTSFSPSFIGIRSLAGNGGPTSGAPRRTRSNLNSDMYHFARLSTLSAPPQDNPTMRLFYGTLREYTRVNNQQFGI